MAAAQGQPGECPQAAPGAGEITLTAFLPSAPCLMAQTVLLTAKWGLWEAAAGLGLTITAGLAMLQLFSAARSGIEKALIPLVTAIVVTSLLIPAAQGTGVVRAMQVEVLSQVRGVYNASATLGNAALSNGPSSVASTTARLGEKIAELLARTQHASVVEMQLQAAKTARDPAFEDPGLAQKLYADAVAKSNEGISFTGVPGGPNWIFNVGYLLLYGFFAIYAGIIWVVWVTLVITVMLLPILMAWCVQGSFKGLQNAGASVLGTVLVIALMPPFTALTATITIGIPGYFLEQRVNTINTDVAASLTRYQNALASGCGRLDGGCVLRRDVVLPMQADLASMKETATWAILAVVCLFVALSIGSTMLRRVPATIMGMFSLPGGGESSGVETAGLSKVLGGLAKMSGASAAMSAGQRALGQKMLGAGSGGKDGGKEGGGAEAKSSGSAGSGAVPPPSVTSGAAPSGGGSGSNVPPASVTGTGSSAGWSPAGGSSSVGSGTVPAAGSTGGSSASPASGTSPSAPSGTAGTSSSGVTPAPAARSAVGRGIAAVQAARANPVGTAKAGLQAAAAKTGAAITAAAFSPQEQERFASARQAVSDIKADVRDVQEARSTAREEASWTRAAAVPAPANPDASEATPVRQGAHPNPTAVAQNARAGGADGPQNRQAVAGLRAGGQAGEFSGNVTVSTPVSTAAHPVAGGGTPAPATPPAPVTPAPVTPAPAPPRNERRQGVVTAAPVQSASEWKPTPAPAAPATPASALPARAGLRPAPAQPARVQPASAPQTNAGSSTPAPAAPAPVQPAPAPVTPTPVQPASATPAPAPVTPKVDDTEVKQ